MPYRITWKERDRKDQAACTWNGPEYRLAVVKFKRLRNDGKEEVKVVKITGKRKVETDLTEAFEIVGFGFGKQIQENRNAG